MVTNIHQHLLVAHSQQRCLIISPLPQLNFFFSTMALIFCCSFTFKNNSRPLFFLHQTLSLALCQHWSPGFHQTMESQQRKRHFMNLPTRSSCADVVSKDSLLQLEDRQFVRAMRFSTLESRSVNLSDLSLHAWGVVAPRHFHITTAATVDSFNRAEVWWTDLLGKWHPIMVLHWKSLRSFETDR